MQPQTTLFTLLSAGAFYIASNAPGLPQGSRWGTFTSLADFKSHWEQGQAASGGQYGAALLYSPQLTDTWTVNPNRFVNFVTATLSPPGTAPFTEKEMWAVDVGAFGKIVGLQMFKVRTF